MIAPTSHKAYNTEVVTTLNARQKQILKLFNEYPEQNFTDKEIARKMALDINQVTPRRGELVKAGVLTEAGERACRVTNRSVMSWKLRGEATTQPQFPAPAVYQFESRTREGHIYKTRLIRGKWTCTCWGFKRYQACKHTEKAIADNSDTPQTSKLL